jgi:hypothetical protein
MFHKKWLELLKSASKSEFLNLIYGGGHKLTVEDTEGIQINGKRDVSKPNKQNKQRV